MSIHATSTKVYSGAQMLTKNGMATPSTDTSFWASFSRLAQVDSGNGWATLTRSITNDYSNIQTSTDSVDLIGNSTYTAIVEIQNCSIASGILVFAQTTAAQDPVSAYTVVSGCNSVTGNIMGVAISGSSTPRYNVYVFSTKSSFQRGLGYYFHPDTGAGSLDIRATVLAGDHSSDWQDYCGDNYEPYVGATPSPLIKGVAHVSTSKNLLNTQSDSNGEYFGTTSQQTYSGKNLYLPIPVLTPSLGIGAVYDNITGEITLSGTGSSTWSDTFSQYYISLPAGAYTISLSNTIPLNARIRIMYTDNTYADATVWNTQTSVTATATQNIKSFRLWFSGTNGTNVDGVKFKIQVETGSTATSFEPYVGGIPSPNLDYPQEIVTGKIAGKNLLDLSTFVKGRVDNGVIGYANDTTSFSYTDDSITYTTVANYRGVVSDFIPVKPNTPYISSASSYGSSGMYRDYYDSSKNWISRSTDNPQVTPSNCAYMRVNLQYSSTGTTTVSRPMLEEGSTATTFEPYFTPIELAKIGDYQDKVYKSGDDWYTRKEIAKVVLNGTGDYGTLGNGSGGEKRFRLIDSAVGNIPTNVRGTYCDKYQGVTQSSSVPTPNSIAQWSQQNMLLVTTDKTTYSLDDFKADLATSPATVYCVGATPTDTAITDSATILWLNKYDTDSLPHHKYINTRRTTYVGASGLASAIDLYDGSYASTLPTYSTANDHHLTTANGGTYTVSLQNISAKIISGTVTFSVFTNQRKIDFSWNGSATSTSVSVSLQADEYIKSIYAYIPQDADAGITLSQQLESGSLTDFEPYYNIVKIYAGDDLVFEDTSLTD